MKYVLRAVLLTFAAVQLISCSKGNNSLLDASGKHPDNWIVAHREAFRSLAGANDDPAITQKSRCVECHGADLKGGITKVSCFSQGFAALSCHFHPAGYRNGDIHGANAKDFGTSLGLRTCQGCHGSQYAGGVLSAISCSSASSLADPAFACHGVSAPHAKNWAASTIRRHSSTDPRNAAECAQCHAGGRLLTSLPVPPVQPAGTAPGCFNNTLCHSGLHPAGWIDPAQHGVTAKSQPGSDKGFTSCQVCHGTDFAGGSSQVSCFTASRANGACHVRNSLPVNAPHAALPWRAAAPTPSHTSTVDDAQGLNAGACGRCHLRGANLRTPILTTYANGTPGCFNSTLCHGIVGHSAGWADPSQHGATAKANLTFCQGCHSSDPTGGPGSNPRFNVVLGRLTAGCETCHEPNIAHPPVLQIPVVFGITSPDPLGTPWFRHRLATGLTACDRCHGIDLAGGVGPRCQKCHVAALPTTTVKSPDPCSSCHSQPPSGTTYPNINRAHGNHKTLNVPNGGLCAECHSGLGSGTLDHFLRAKNISLTGATSTQPSAVVFGGVLSRAKGATPVFDLATLQCTNTYCHGATLTGGGSNKSPLWDQTNYLAAAGCGTCHGFPPSTVRNGAATHTTGTTCSGCHPTDPAKHINGSVEVSSAHAFPNPGSAHKTASNGTGCITAGCHAQGTAGASPYPVAVGTPPNCRACHLNANPTTAPRCSDCHGDASTGRPTGANFPNRQGSADGHNRGTHRVACTTCHPFTNSDSRHGWSNRKKSTAAQVGGVGTSITSWDPAGNSGRGSCLPACHGSEAWY